MKRPRHRRVQDHEVIEIARRVYERGEKKRDIAKEYGVHEVWIGRLLLDRSDLFHVVVRTGRRPPTFRDVDAALSALQYERDGGAVEDARAAIAKARGTTEGGG